MGLTSVIQGAREVAGTRSPEGKEARPVEEFGALHRAIAASSRASLYAASELVKALTEVISTKPDSIKARALLVVELVDGVRKLGYSDYRALIGAVHLCREDKSGAKLGALLEEDRRAAQFPALSEQVRGVVDILKHLHGARFVARNHNLPAPQGSPGVDVELNKGFAEEAMLFLRAIHPLGVNIRNGSWSRVAGAVAYPAEKLIALQLGGACGVPASPRPDRGTIVIKPKNDTSVVKFIPQGLRWDEVHDHAVLRNGESIVVGRSLSLPDDILGVNISRKIEVPVDIRIVEERAAWSRGSLCIYRSGDGRDLFLLDRGTRSPICSPDELGAIQTYVPRTVIAPDGSIFFGESQVGR
jgi:hypothetical protein